jgi:Cerato-platanin
MMFPLSSLLVLAASALAVQVSFDPVYDKGKQSLDTVACSTGSNGLITKNFTTFDSLPHFPNIGGASAVTGFNSPGCGTCWALTYKNLTINVCNSVHVLFNGTHVDTLLFLSLSS